MALTSGLRALLGVFGALLEAGMQYGRGAAVMWQAYTNAYESIGQSRPPATLQDMNTFVAGLGSIMRSMSELSSASDEAALTAQFMAPQIGYVNSPADYANPSIVATYLTTIQTEEGMVQRWSSVAYNTVFPTTIGDLRADATLSVQEQLDQAAMEEGNDSPTAGGTVSDIQKMYILTRGV